MPPGNFEKLHSEIEFEGIFSNLLPFNAPVDIGIQNVLKNIAITCMPISMQLFSYCLLNICALPAIAISAIVK